jgi:hypothetical protein
MKLNSVRLLLIGLIASLSLVGCQLQEKQNNSGEATLIIKSLGSTKTERFKFTKGTPLGILKYNYKVETLLNDNFIECIDDVCADGNYMWLFYVNNKTINYGVKRYELMDGDVVMFEFSNKDTSQE